MHLNQQFTCDLKVAAITLNTKEKMACRSLLVFNLDDVLPHASVINYFLYIHLLTRKKKIDHCMEVMAAKINFKYI